MKKLGAVPLPSTESMEKELSELTVQKDALLTEYRTARSEVQEYETVKKNVNDLLSYYQREIELDREYQL